MKTALVLSGGGSRGAYQIGVWQALREADFRFEIVTGTSVGALNGAMIAQNSFDTALSLWEELSTESVFDLSEEASFSAYAKEFFKNGGVSAQGLTKLLASYLDEAAVRSSEIAFGLVTVEKKTLTPCEVFTEDIPQGKLADYLLASAACYPAVASHPIEDTDYIDGGYYNNFPVELAQKKGAQKIIAVNLQAVGIVRNRVKQLQADKNILYLSPKWDLGNFLIFNHDTIKRNIRLGYLDTLKALSYFDGTLYAYQKHSFSDYARKKHTTLKQWKEFFRSVRLKGSLLQTIGYSALERALQKETKHLLTLPVILEVSAEITGKIFSLSPLLLYTADTFHIALTKEAQAVLKDCSIRSLIQKKGVSPTPEFFRHFQKNVISVLLGYYFCENPQLLFRTATFLPKESIAGFYLFVCGLLPPISE